MRVNPGPNPSSYLGQRWNIYLPHVDTQTNSPHSEKVPLERFYNIVSMYQSRPIQIGKSRWLENSSPQHFRILFIWHWSYYWVLLFETHWLSGKCGKNQTFWPNFCKESHPLDTIWNVTYSFMGWMKFKYIYLFVCFDKSVFSLAII